MIYGSRISVGFMSAILAMSCAAPAWAASTVFTWNPGDAVPRLNGSAFTADQISTTDFLFNRSDAAGLAFDDFVLRIASVSRNGAPVIASGLGSGYDLYLQGHVTLHSGPGGASIYDTGTVSLIADPTNNDGTLAASWDPTTQTGGVGFSNPSQTYLKFPA
jgi:hypothetical protein